MNFLSLPFFMIICAIANRARGSHLFEMTNSTTISRLVGLGVIALTAGLYHFNPDFYTKSCSLYVFAWMLAGLLLWCVPRWDYLWSATIGNEPQQSREWGLLHLTLRMLYGVPCLIGLCYLTRHMDRLPFAAIPALFGLPYYIWGRIDTATAVPRSEYTAGALWGLAIWGIMA